MPSKAKDQKGGSYAHQAQKGFSGAWNPSGLAHRQAGEGEFPEAEHLRHQRSEASGDEPARPRGRAAVAVEGQAPAQVASLPSPPGDRREARVSR